MDFPEMIFLIAVTVILPISVLSLLFSYQKARLRSKKGDADNELTTSELQNMIDSAVAEAAGELQERVELLENQLLLLNPSRDDGEAGQTEGSKTMGNLTRE